MRWKNSHDPVVSLPVLSCCIIYLPNNIITSLFWGITTIFIHKCNLHIAIFHICFCTMCQTVPLYQPLRGKWYFLEYPTPKVKYKLTKKHIFRSNSLAKMKYFIVLLVRYYGFRLSFFPWQNTTVATIVLWLCISYFESRWATKIWQTLELHCIAYSWVTNWAHRYSSLYTGPENH